MSFEFHPEAEQDINDAVEHYDRCSYGLGLDFTREVLVAIQNAEQHPWMWPVVEDEIHRCLVHRFPYGILYRTTDDGIFILAIMHLHRNPRYWKDRTL